MVAVVDNLDVEDEVELMLMVEFVGSVAARLVALLVIWPRLAECSVYDIFPSLVQLFKTDDCFPSSMAWEEFDQVVDVSGLTVSEIDEVVMSVTVDAIESCSVVVPLS